MYDETRRWNGRKKSKLTESAACSSFLLSFLPSILIAASHAFAKGFYLFSRGPGVTSK